MARWLQGALRRIDKFLSIDVNPDPVSLSSIRSQVDVNKWRVFSDAAFGGLSRGSLELRTEEEGGDVSVACLHRPMCNVYCVIICWCLDATSNEPPK